MQQYAGSYAIQVGITSVLTSKHTVAIFMPPVRIPICGNVVILIVGIIS